MRILLVTQDDPFYLPGAVGAFCAARPDTTALAVLPAFNESRWATARRLLGFYGPIDFVRLLARYAWARLLDLVNRVAPVSRPRSAADAARRHGVPVLQPRSVNSNEFLTQLREELQPDLVVSIAASQIFKKQILALPPLGCINLHSAPLPKYQGMMPNFWTMVHGEPHATVTVHFMDRSLDSGDIVLQREVPIEPEDSLHDLMVRSKIVGVEALLEAVRQLEEGSTEPRPMPTEGASYFTFPKREDARKLRRQGRRLL